MRHHGPRRSKGGNGRPKSQPAGHEATALPVLVIGLGEIGRKVASAASRHPELTLVGAADPAFEGRSLRELVPDAPELRVAPSGSALYRHHRGAVAFVCTSSRFEEAMEEIGAAVRAGLHVVSSCEELAAADFVDPELADTLDRNAQRSGVAVLGVGVNPGFVFDRLPVTLGAVAGEIRFVEGTRIVDLAARRPALAKKAGVGLSPERFEELADEGEVGHVGLSESVALLADGLGLSVDEVEEEIDPLIAEADAELHGERIAAGRVVGFRQVARGFDEEREVVRLSLECRAGAVQPEDRIRIDAEPPIDVVVPGGVSGDVATAWALVNAAVRVAAAEPGLLSVLDLPAGR